MNGNVPSTGGGSDVVQRSCHDTSLEARDKVPENEDRVHPSKTLSKCSSHAEAEKCTDHIDALKPPSELHLIENVNCPLESGTHEICAENQEPNSKSEGCILPLTEETANPSHDNEDTPNTELYLCRTCESDEDALSDDSLGLPCIVEDELHYITTHGIQLSELSDNEVDNNIEVGSCGDMEADNQIYSFADYASFDCDETREVGERVQNDDSQIESSVLDHDIFGKAARDSSEWLGKCDGNSEGQIHLSIKTTSLAINEPDVQQNENILCHATHAEDASRYAFRGADPNADRLCDEAKCFIAAPGRSHFGSKVKGRDFNEYSSSASSAVSELDDADKEVRNLTARAFKSLAYPYLDSINFCTSSESSASERGLGINRWSTFVDLKYGNISQGRGQNSMTHKMSSCTMAKKDDHGCKGGALTNIKSSPGNVLNLNSNPHNAASQKKIAVVGKFGQGHSGVITLTETLNFRCNVKSGLPAGERRSKCAQNPTGSRSTYEVTNASPGGQGSETRRRPGNAKETMEDTHKKAIFASSLLKNVISKKMQFEQERKMERGEICEPCQVPSSCFDHQELENTKENCPTSEPRDRQSSKYSEDSSDYTIVCVQELGDIVDSSSCDGKRSSGTQASCAELESANEGGFDSKKGALEAAKSTLLRSQNSAFRSWRDGELEFQKELKNDKTAEWNLSSTEVNPEDTGLCADSGTSKLSKMSLLFVPSIQLPPSEREADHQQEAMNYSTRAHTDPKEGGGVKFPSDNALYVPDSTRTCVTSKSPEIKIKLKKLEDNEIDKFNMSMCPISNVFCNGANLIKTADDSRCHALAPVIKGESTEKVPHFTVRDIRDRKGKLQTPIHQVRDVRKLVKSSYHFVSLDNNDSKLGAYGLDLHSEQRIPKHGCHKNSASVSPIVIKCQSVNTNSNVRESENLVGVSQCELNKDTFEMDRSSPEGASLIHRFSKTAPLSNTDKDLSEGQIGLRIETRPASRKQETTPDITVKNENNMTNKSALEKLQAAVKTMERLYVFDRNEWKRKSNPSHVLSLVTQKELYRPKEEDGHISNTRPTSITEKLEKRDSHPGAYKSHTATTSSPSLEMIKENKPKKTFYFPHNREVTDGPKLLSQQGGGTACKNTYLSSGQKTSINTTASIQMNTAQSHVISQAPPSTQGFRAKSSKFPASLKISQARCLVEESERSLKMEAGKPATHTQSISSAVPENYLTIPFKSHTTSTELTERSGHDQGNVYNFRTTGTNAQTSVRPPERMSHADAPRKQEVSRQSPKHDSQSHDPPPATIYHHPLPMTMSPAQHQVLCFSPTLTPMPTIDLQPTQRKMLLDPTTGNYYLVDTPVQPATKRLFDPETGQYVDVPMPQSPMTPMPMPMSISPLALSPGAFGHSYMMYPGFMSTPTMIPARTIQSQMSMTSEADNGNKGSHSQQSEGVYMESPYFMATGKSPLPQHAANVRTPRAFINDKPPVINIASQQGPRIIAPPSFDGTTMSFVVEHR